MLKNKFYRTLLVAGITGSLVISTAVVAFASTTTTKTNEKNQRAGNAFMQKGDIQRVNPLVSVLKTQVTAGTITQAEADQVTAALKTKGDAKKVERIAQKATKDAMTSAEKTAAITAQKATKDAEKAKLKAMTDTERQAYIKANKPAKENIFTSLVTDGILTQDQATKIQAAMSQRNKMDNFKGQKSRKSQVAPTITSTNE